MPEPDKIKLQVFIEGGWYDGEEIIAAAEKAEIDTRDAIRFLEELGRAKGESESQGTQSDGGVQEGNAPQRQQSRT